MTDSRENLEIAEKITTRWVRDNMTPSEMLVEFNGLPTEQRAAVVILGLYKLAEVNRDKLVGAGNYGTNPF